MKGGKYNENRKITAKLRDAVPVCLMVNGEEVKRYKNIELPDEPKEVEMTDFHIRNLRPPPRPTACISRSTPSMAGR